MPGMMATWSRMGAVRVDSRGSLEEQGCAGRRAETQRRLLAEQRGVCAVGTD